MRRGTKTQEMHNKSTYPARPQTALKLLGTTSRVLTSSKMEIKRKSDEVQLLLQHIKHIWAAIERIIPLLDMCLL